MTILVGGASGNLGRMVIDRLLTLGVPASDLVAGARSPGRLDDLRTRGIGVVALDHDDPGTLRQALRGVDRFVLVSVSQPDTPLSQHDAVISAAAQAGVEALVYTSVYRAEDSALPLAPVHAAAEAAIAASGVPAVVLRNNSYTELFVGPVQQAARTGVLSAAAGHGRIAAATRRDFADAAAAAILDETLLGRTLELSGDTSFSYADLAAVASRIGGREVNYQSLTQDELRSRLTAQGLDPAIVDLLVSIDAAIDMGHLDSSDRTLSDLIGRPTTPYEQTLRASAG